MRQRVRDDGSGFDPADYQEPVGRRKLGVLGMTERAVALGGRLEVSSQPGRGTEIRAEFELPRQCPFPGVKPGTRESSVTYGLSVDTLVATMWALQKKLIDQEAQETRFSSGHRFSSSTS